MSNINQNELNNDSYEKTPAIIKYFIISFLINITMIMFNVFSSKGVSHGFWAWVLILTFSTIFSTFGATIGNFVREIAHPDAIITNGGMYEILKTKLFWAIGPQSIGWIIGLAIGNKILTKWFGIPT